MAALNIKNRQRWIFL